MSDKTGKETAQRDEASSRQKRRLSFNRATSPSSATKKQTSPTTSPSSKRRHVLRYLSNGFRKLLPSHPVSAKGTNTEEDAEPNTEAEADVDSGSGPQCLPERRNRPLQSTPSNVTSSTRDLDAAATVIQRAWRRRALEPLVAEWHRFNLTVERLSAMSFEDATKLMQNTEMIQTSASLLSLLLSTSSDAQRDKDPEYKAPARTFISGYLFAAHPRLLETGNTHIDAMTESSAMTMTKAFVQFKEAFIANDSSWYRCQQTFAAGFKAFYFALDSWKRSDTRMMLVTMERHYLELDRLWQSVQRRTLGEGDENWRVGIQAQREQLLGKIHTLGGDSAVDDLMQRQRELRQTYDDPQPSPTPSLIPPSQSAYSPTVGAQFPPAAAQSQQESSDAESNGSADAGDPSVVLTKAIADRETHSIDQVLGSFDLTAASTLQDAKLAHEIILDPELRLEPAPDNTLVGAVQKAVTRAFFEHIRQDIESGNSDYIIRTLSQLRLDLRTVIPPSSEMHAAIEREFDQEWLSKQLSNGALDIREKYRLILNTIRSVCAPARDPEIDELASDLEAVDEQGLKEVARSISKDEGPGLSSNARASVDKLLSATQRIMELIRNIRMDVLNYQLATIVRPWLRIHAVEYERAAVAKKLQEEFGGDRAQITRRITDWMRPAVVCEETNGCILQAQKSPDKPLSAKHVFFESFLGLCFAATALTTEATPETFALDQSRIHYMQNEIQTLLCTAALCALARGLAQIDDSRMRQAAQIFASILRADNVTMDRIVQGMQDVIPHCEVQSVRRLVQKTLAKEDPVYQAMELRLRRFLLAQLDKDEPPGALGRRVFGDGRGDVAAELAKASLDVVREEICALLLRISQLCSFNWQVYSGWYSRVLHLADADANAER